MGIANITDYFPHYLRNLNIAISGNLAKNNYQAIGYRCLAGNPGIRVFFQNGVKNGI
jgi:hypothetical protein